MALNVATGQYTGNGSSRSITGLGFQVKLLFLHGNNATNSASGQIAIWRSGTACSSFFSADNTTNETTSITALGTDGFSLGVANWVNVPSTVFDYLAIGGDDIVVGSYTGNGTDNRSITGVGFTPAFVIIKGLNNDFPVVRYGGMSGDNALEQGFFGGLAANHIQAMEADGFQVGTDATVNNSGTVYYYAAIKANTTSFVTSSYTGNATDNRSITGVGFTPTAILGGQALAATRNGIFTISGSDSTSVISNQLANITNAYQAFEADGFQIGTSSYVNTNTNTYYYFAAKTGTDPAPTTNSGFLMFM